MSTLDGYIGRREEREEFRRLLQKKTASLLTCQGRRRIGKSRFITECAQEADHFLSFMGLPPREDITRQAQLDAFARKAAGDGRGVLAQAVGKTEQPEPAATTREQDHRTPRRGEVRQRNGHLGTRSTRHPGRPADPQPLPIDHAMHPLARLGDQLRFKAMPAGSRPIVSYVLDETALASPFGTADHRAMVALSAAIDRHLAGAREIRVTCPLGTDLAGAIAPERAAAPYDTSIKRFPQSVHRPVDATGFSGRVAVAHMLCGTGSRYYQPYGIPLASPVIAEIGGGRIRGWSGRPDVVARVEDHVATVADRFGIDGALVHSWHTGIHPGCAYPGSAHDHYERWSGSAFGNPRILHFHTCGHYAPGEICWNIIDPTVAVDGVPVWRDGRLDIAAVPGAAAILAEHPDVAALFAAPERRIGLDAAA